MKNLLLVLASFLFLSLTSMGQEIYLGSSQPEDFQAGDQIELPPGYSPSAINCLPCALPEGEADIQTDGDDVVNGGCNSTPIVFTEINIGDVYCSRTNTYLKNGSGNRDTDWYRITLTETKTLYWSSIADCPLNIIIASDLGGCNANVLSSDTDIPAGTIGQTSYTLSPGTYYFWVGLPVFTGWDAGADYQVILSEGPPSDPWCTITSVPVSNWAIVLGVFLIGAFMVVRYRRRLA